MIYVHRAVACTYLVNDDYSLYVNHKDGNKCNNDVRNLEWVTNKENYWHGRSIGLIHTGEDLSYARISNNCVHDICRLLEKEYSYDDIIHELKLESDTKIKPIIISIYRREKWKDISKNYHWEIKNRRRKFDDNEIEVVCDCLSKNMPLKDILKILNVPDENYQRYKKMVNHVYHRRIYTRISDKYNW